jgi:hydroxymethylpyrimidine/phosphomethylpyrimidine kinase
MVAASGDRLLDEDAEQAYEDLLAKATLVTPNADEAAVLTDITVDDTEGAQAAGEALLEMGVEAALVKGGHVEGSTVEDVLVTDEGATTFAHPRIDTDATHGSGCTLSSAIAARLARGEALATAVEESVAFMERAVRYHYDVGEGPGAVQHLVALRERGAREATMEAVAETVDTFVATDVSRLVPEVGMNVVGATPFAEQVAETAAVEGRITRTMTGVAPNRGVRCGASSHVARFLLAAREHAPGLRFAVNCRFDDAIEAALDALSGSVGEFDRDDQPDDIEHEEGSTMGWAAEQVYGGDKRPVAVIDRGAVGKEAIVKLLAADAAALTERTTTLLSAVDG